MLFDSTLRRELARNFGGTLVVILTIVLTVMFIRNLGQAALGRIAPQDIMLLLAYIGLGNLPTLLALSLFIAVVATLSRMYRGSEMTIWFAERRAAAALRQAGAADQLAGAARHRRALALRLAVAERAQHAAEGSVRAPLRPVPHRSGGSSSRLPTAGARSSSKAARARRRVAATS